MNDQHVEELYKTTSAWSFHLLEGIQERIESQLPDLKKKDQKTDRVR